MLFRQIFAEVSKGRKCRVSNNNWRFSKFESSHCTHTAAPKYYPKSKKLEKIDNSLNLPWFAHSETDGVMLIVMSAGNEVKAGHWEMLRQEPDDGECFCPGGRISMKVKHHPHILSLWLVCCQRNSLLLVLKNHVFALKSCPKQRKWWTP